jgi:hypothetical protein
LGPFLWLEVMHVGDFLDYGFFLILSWDWHLLLLSWCWLGSHKLLEEVRDNIGECLLKELWNMSLTF